MDLSNVHVSLPLITSLQTLSFYQSSLTGMSNSLPNMFDKMWSTYRCPKLDMCKTMFPFPQTWSSSSVSFQQMATPLFAKSNQLLESSLPPLFLYLTTKGVFTSKMYTLHTLLSPFSATTLVQAPPFLNWMKCSSSPTGLLLLFSPTLVQFALYTAVTVSFLKYKLDHLTPPLTTLWRFLMILKRKPKLVTMV